MESSTNTTNTTTTTTNNHPNLNHQVTIRKTSDHDLKAAIIEFMRDRPFLWNSKHPLYKDHKRREQEFVPFSKQCGCSVQEIKRVWHVLRTNFFRAHKIMIDRPHTNGESGGEKLWKYYLAMEYILENSDSLNESGKQPRSANSSLGTSKKERIRNLKREINQISSNNNTGNASSNNNNNSKNWPVVTYPSLSSTSVNSTNLNGSICSNNNDISPSLSFLNNSTSTAIRSSSFIEPAGSFDSDDDHLYARSLTATLKKFDPTTKEIIKLKFQEIIVSYMQQLHQKNQSQTQPRPKQTDASGEFAATNSATPGHSVKSRDESSSTHGQTRNSKSDQGS